MSESEITAGKNHVGSTGYVWLYNRETGDFNGLPILLGRLAVCIEGRPRPGERCIVTSWQNDSDAGVSSPRRRSLVKKALSIDDRDPVTLAGFSATSALMVGDSEGEIEMADRAVALNPNSFDTWNSRGLVYKVAGLPEEAVRSFERAIRMSPVDSRLPGTLTGMGQALIELRRSDEAVVAGKKAQRQNPSHMPACRCLASAFAHLGRDVEAREAAARALDVDPASTISAIIARGGLSNAKLLIEGLRKAGLPE